MLKDVYYNGEVHNYNIKAVVSMTKNGRKT